MRTLAIVIFAVLGVACLVVAGFFYWRNYEFHARSVTVDGVVVSCDEHRPTVDRDNVSWKCALDWKDSAGASHRFVSYDSATNRPAGSVMALRYDPQHPDDVRRDVGPGLALFVFGGIGVVFVAIAARAARG